MAKIKTPKAFLCPMTGQLMDEPRYWIDGEIYSYAGVERLLKLSYDQASRLKKINQLNTENVESLENLRKKIAEFMVEKNICALEEYRSAKYSNDINKLKNLNYLDIYAAGVYEPDAFFSSKNGVFHLGKQGKNKTVVHFLKIKSCLSLFKSKDKKVDSCVNLVLEKPRYNTK